MQNENLLEVKNLSKYFQEKSSIFDKFSKNEKQKLIAVDNVSFTIARGECLGLVGESGCGKSTLAKCILRLLEPDTGEIVLNDLDITHLKGEPLRKIRPQIQMIFQDPYSSLNPRMSVNSILSEMLSVHHIVEKEDIPNRVNELLKLSGLTEDIKDRYPGEFSGGQRQRIGIARAISLNPEFIVADEPVSALDVSIQAQILNLLSDIHEELNQTLLFISHDLNVVRHITQRVLVMYLGSNVELGSTQEVFNRPFHPYTNILMQASPKLDPRNRKKTYVIEGEPPSPINVPKGCKFHTRCPYRKEICGIEIPEMRELEEGHFVACHFPLNINDQSKKGV